MLNGIVSGNGSAALPGRITLAKVRCTRARCRSRFGTTTPMRASASDSSLARAQRAAHSISSRASTSAMRAAFASIGATSSLASFVPAAPSATRKSRACGDIASKPKSTSVPGLATAGSCTMRATTSGSLAPSVWRRPAVMRSYSTSHSKNALGSSLALLNAPRSRRHPWSNRQASTHWPAARVGASNAPAWRLARIISSHNASSCAGDRHSGMSAAISE